MNDDFSTVEVRNRVRWKIIIDI